MTTLGKELEAKARAFAYKHHSAIDHRRKYTNAPYVFHLEEVALLVKTATVWDYAMVAAALLHDVVEDTSVDIQEVYEEFGYDVAYLINGLTDVSKPEDGNREARKKIDRERLATRCGRTHTIKTCDLISNTRDIVKYDKDFARVYLREKRLLLPMIAKGDAKLHALANELANQELGK